MVLAVSVAHVEGFSRIGRKTTDLVVYRYNYTAVMATIQECTNQGADSGEALALEVELR